MRTIPEILSEYFQNKSLINTNGFKNNPSPLSKTDETQVLNFMYVDLPSTGLLDSKKTIVSVLGWSGSGLSTFINYILNHELILDESMQLISVKNKELPHALIGTNTAESQTLVPQLYPFGDITLCDGTGIQDEISSKQRFLIDLSLRSSSAAILVISHSIITLDNRRFLSNLFIRISSQLDEEDMNNKIIFVFNSRGDTRLNYDHYKTYIKACANNLKNTLRSLKFLISQFDEMTSLGITEMTSQERDMMRNLGINKQVGTPISECKNIAMQLQSKIERAIKLVSQITNQNSFVWQSYNEKTCKRDVAAKLETISKSPQRTMYCRDDDEIKMIKKFKEKIALWLDYYQQELFRLTNESPELLESVKPFYLDLYNKTQFIYQLMGDSENKTFAAFLEMYQSAYIQQVTQSPLVTLNHFKPYTASSPSNQFSPLQKHEPC